MKKLAIVFMAFIYMGCSNEKGNTLQIPEDINDGVRVSNVESHDLDTLLLSQLNTDIYNGMYGNIHSLLVMKDDELVVEQYYNEGERDEIHFLASVTKGFVAILIGIAMDQEYIDSLNRPMLDYFPEYKKAEKDNRKHKITIEHLLTMTSGFEWDELTLPFTDPNNDGVRMDKEPHLLNACLRLKMDTVPGTKYVYCGPNDIILGEIIKVATKQNIEEFAVKNLFEPLQINEYRWSSRNGVYHTGGGLWMKSRGMLKFGQSNISAYTMGLVGYKTPNIDRIADEGMIFTDYYAEQSCTAGRSSFILGQSVFRTGLSKVGLPGAKEGISSEDPTIAELLKPLGYATGQFGKNHLGDRDEHLPTNHGFDEFYGNLYHLNAEEEPELPDYPTEEKLPGFREEFGPRGVIHSFADGRVEDTGPLTKKRMETIDDVTSDAAIEFIKNAVKEDKPFFVWWNGTRMHFRTHVKEELRGISGQDEYGDGMVEHDMHVGKFLDLLKELGIEDNTIVVYSTDNGPHKNTWPDAAVNPFRGEKNTNWEGGWRVPAMVKWPGKIKAGSVSNEIVSGMDWMPTFLAAAGQNDIKEKLLSGYEANGKNFKVHLDGYNLLPYLTEKEEKSPRKEIFYFSDDGNLTALRYNDWKLIFMEQRATGTMKIWSEPFVELRMPLILNLRRDPYEMAPVTSNTYYDWYLDHLFLMVPAQTYVGDFLETFKEYPPRMKAASFSLDKVMEKLTTPANK